MNGIELSVRMSAMFVIFRTLESCLKAVAVDPSGLRSRVAHGVGSLAVGALFFYMPWSLVVVTCGMALAGSAAITKGLLTLLEEGHSPPHEVLREIQRCLSCGQTFRDALASVARMSPVRTRKFLDQWARSLRVATSDLDQAQNPLAWRFFSWSRRLDGQQHTAEVEVAALQARLQWEHEFRRKSGQVTQQVRVQALVLAGIYVICVAVRLLSAGSDPQVRNCIYVSVTFFVGGLLWMRAILHSFRPKI